MNCVYILEFIFLMWYDINVLINSLLSGNHYLKTSNGMEPMVVKYRFPTKFKSKFENQT
jgi:hypothetical protein